MIFPSIKIVRKPREDINRNYRLKAHQKFQFASKSEVNHAVTQDKRPEVKSFSSPLRSYRAYSKTKTLVRNNNISPSPKPFLQPITIPELAITPEYLSMIKYFTEKMHQNLQIPFISLHRAPDIKPKVSLVKVEPQPSFIDTGRKSNRKVVLSRTPDPWKKLEYLKKGEIDESDSEKCLSNNYDY